MFDTTTVFVCFFICKLEEFQRRSAELTAQGESWAALKVRIAPCSVLRKQARTNCFRRFDAAGTATTAAVSLMYAAAVVAADRRRG